MNYDEMEVHSPSRSSLIPVVSVICGICACLFNAFIITLPLGIPLGFFSFGFGLYSLLKYRKAAGFFLSLLSLLILLIWIGSLVIPLMVDPTLSLDPWFSR